MDGWIGGSAGKRALSASAGSARKVRKVAGKSRPPVDRDEVDVEIREYEPVEISLSTASRTLYGNWQGVIPTLIKPLLNYLARTVGQPLEKSPSIISACAVNSCAQKRSSIVSLFFDLLILHGLFPTAPLLPRIAVSIELLSFYRALFERSCDAVNALAATLKTHYARRGFQSTDEHNNPNSKLHRETSSRNHSGRSLGHAVQWYDILHVKVERTIEEAIQQARDRIRASCEPSPPVRVVHPSQEVREVHPSQEVREVHPVLMPNTLDTSQEARSESHLHREHCASILVERVLFGRPLDQGGDIHVATDGNFHHRHCRSAGDCPHFYNPSYFLPKTYVDQVGSRIHKNRKRPATTHTPIVPNEAIDQCEQSYEAADGKKQKTAMESFDDTGLMALICRHDIPLFFTNIDTPGEQQKYSVALLEHLFSLLPTQATVIALYDVGCVLARSLSQYHILDVSITSRLRFATTAMHVYGHEWGCQLVYNPRMCVGMGLSDGEGTERLWSRLIRLIGIERSSSRQRRLWLIDRQAASIGAEMCTDLGDWIKRRFRGIKTQVNTTEDILNHCGVSIEDLRSLWADQRRAQLSVRAHAPARLKKELDTVLALQSDMDTSDRALQATRTMLEKEAPSDDTLSALEGLERGHQRLMDKVEALYASLNIHDRFPELQGVNLDFVRTLLMARDLKINIHKRAIGSFFEWDKLDRAVGGAQQALGTKLHQQTRKAIAKRQPALMTAIRKFNSYCEHLDTLYDPSWGIPLPMALPTKLADLRNDQALMEDVWIAPSAGDIPRWLDDSDVRDGIRALLKHDRCQEERQRLSIEADNLCRYFGDELAALELALSSDANELFIFSLRTRRDHLLQLRSRWENPFASVARFSDRVKVATDLAKTLTRGATKASLSWIHNPPILAIDHQEDDIPDFEAGPASSIDAHQIAFSDFLEEDAIADEDIEDIDEAEKADVTICWAVPEVLQIDETPVPRKDLRITVQGPGAATRIWPSRHGFPRQIFDPRDISFLGSSTARLNDVCLNGCAILLHDSQMSIPVAQRIAILSTHDLPRIRYNAADEMLWRQSSWTRYWEKDIWILPIHRPVPVGHWVLCVICRSSKELHLFDSFAEKRPWQHDIKLEPLQTNGYDCGVWVLAAIMAVLRGFHSTGLHEDDMEGFRQLLYHLVLDLSVV
ncbi:hypothetical protein DEU56DRAFT_874329 [Suillus clintonianus]|uniref:uncharacterized protein n=1 Tax=Suillus clintonianus TaxID=1904413 RepID=UPI001B864D01|nr:uncharacterized protein DEU56DRAFT_874329 [Suillus clintonianus]KAG2113977.1 hypothetical protein DEU56DRAFT_874329 [Suillus clintonianus]